MYWMDQFTVGSPGTVVSVLRRRLGPSGAVQGREGLSYRIIGTQVTKLVLNLPPYLTNHLSHLTRGFEGYEM